MTTSTTPLTDDGLPTLTSIDWDSPRPPEDLESAAVRLREQHLSSPSCPEWYRKRDREDGMKYWRKVIAAQYNTFRTR